MGALDPGRDRGWSGSRGVPSSHCVLSQSFVSWQALHGSTTRTCIHQPSPWGPFVILVPVVGAFGVVFLVKNFAPEAKGHGVPEVMDAIYYHKGVIRPVVSVDQSAGVRLSIGSGGSIGREGPIIQIGSSFGSTIGQILRHARLAADHADRGGRRRGNRGYIQYSRWRRTFRGGDHACTKSAREHWCRWSLLPRRPPTWANSPSALTHLSPSRLWKRPTFT